MTLKVVSFSEVFKWDTCQRQCYYSFGLNLRPLENSAAINTGIKGHKLLQNFYEFLGEGKTKEEALKLVQKSANNVMHESNISEQGALATAWTLVDNYIRDTDFTSEAVLVENRFLFPASALDSDPAVADYQIGFTPDVVFKRKGNYLDVEDAKFTERAWPQAKLDRCPQIKLYQIFLNLMNYKVSRSVFRFFNTKTGKITEYPFIMTAEDERILIRDFMGSVKEVIKFREQPVEIQNLARRTMNYTVCQYCAFKFPCGLEAQGKDASKTLNNLYKKSGYDYRV